MKETWHRIRTWLDANAPEVLANFRPPVTPVVLSEAQRKLGILLPQQFAQFCLIHDGQQPDGPQLLEGFRLLSVQEIVEEWNIWKGLLDSGDFEGYESDSASGIKSDWWNPKWIPFTSDGSGNHHCLDCDPAPSGTSGQIISMLHDSPERELLGSSFAQWLDAFADALEAGAYVYSQPAVGLTMVADAEHSDADPVLLLFQPDSESDVIESAADLILKAKESASRKNWQEAISYYEQAFISGTVLTNPQEKCQHALHLNNYAWACAQVGEFARAIDASKQALKFGSTLIPAQRAYLHGTKGFTLLQIKEYQQAIDEFTAAIELKSDHGFAYWHRGLALESSKIDLKRAAKDKAKAIELGYIAE